MGDFFNKSFESLKIQSGSEILNFFNFFRCIGKRNIVQNDTAMLVSTIEIETVVGYCITQVSNNVANGFPFIHLKLIGCNIPIFNRL